MAVGLIAVPTSPTDHRAQSSGSPLTAVPPHSSTTEKFEECTLVELRRKIRQNRVSFPSQVPTFAKHDRPDIQYKAVQLYFLFGWSCNRIAQRHGLLRQRVQQILSTWKRRAIQMGYIQEIPPLLAPAEHN
jgi:hypothetical protein